MYFFNNNLHTSLLSTVNRVHSFKIFKKSTKFKRYNRGLTRFIMNRKKYILRKKTTNLILKFSIPVFWAKYISKKKQLIRFYQCYYILGSTMSISGRGMAMRYYESAASNDLLKKNFKINVSFLSKNILLNNTLYNSRVFKGILDFFKYTKFGLALSDGNEVLLSVLNSGNVVQNRNFVTPHLGRKALIMSNTLKILNFKLSSMSILFTKLIRLILVRLIIINRFIFF